jgi:hypothetical protein
VATIQTDADIDFMLKDAGVPVSLGNSRTYGIFRHASEMESDGQGGFVPAHHLILTIRQGTLSGVAEDVDVLIDGTSYRVRSVLPPSRKLVRVAVAG